MLLLEFKLKGRAEQFNLIDEAIRTAQFVANVPGEDSPGHFARNKALRYWVDIAFPSLLRYSSSNG